MSEATVEPFELTVAQAADAIRRRRLSPVELADSLLRRSEALEPRLRVWVTLDPDAVLAAARESQRALDSRGPRGPLHGVPVGVKDIFWTRGVRTTGCSPIHADFVPGRDAAAVARLRQAGAIIMGKTVTTQFACGDPSPTVNPWNAEHTPGGSSSGSAVGVAARMFPGALGTQTAGSVLRPAAYNGVVGFKPTFGRISARGLMTVAWSLDTVGTLSRTVEDAAILLSVLASPRRTPPAAATAFVADPPAAGGRDARPPRIGVVRALFAGRTDAETGRHFREVVRALADAGADVDDAAPVDTQALLAAHRTVMQVECATVHQGDFAARPDDYAPKVRALIEAGLGTTAVAYAQALTVQRQHRQAMRLALRGFDVALTPSAPSAAPRDLTTTGDPVLQTPWTFCGFPSITIPSGLGAAGLPLGIQLAAPPRAEQTLLAAALWCEQALAAHLRPPV